MTIRNQRTIQFSPPDLTNSEILEVIETIQSGWITTGKRTKQFEQELAAYVGTEKVVCLNSATAALELSLRVLGIGPGDEVITSAYTYTATAAVIHHVGAKIVLVDTQPDSFEMDYNQVADAINENTKAIIPVDLAGIMADYDTLFEILEQKRPLFRASNQLQALYGRVVVIADAAHSLGARRGDTAAGNVSDFTCFSFHAVKNLTTGEGGAVTWRDWPGLDHAEIYRQFQLYSLHGQTKDAFSKTQIGAWEYDIELLGYKFNMPDLMAAIGLKQLQRYDMLLERRRQIIKRYEECLRYTGTRTLPHYRPNESSSGHLYMLHIPGIDADTRNHIIQQMAKKGIPCNVHYKPLPLLTAYKDMGFSIENYPNAYNLYQGEITLPLHTLLSDEDILYITHHLKAIIQRYRTKYIFHLKKAPSTGKRIIFKQDKQLLPQKEMSPQDSTV